MSSQPWRPKFREVAAAQPQVIHEIARRLPEELWRHIFWEASATPGVDEFSHNPAFHFNDLLMGDMGTSHMSPHQLRIACQCRLQLVLVCRAFASIGTSILWSHLHLVGNYRNILDTLRRNRRRGTYVRRISPPLAWRLLRSNEIADGDHIQPIINLCPNASIISMPLSFDALPELPCAVEHIHVHIWSDCKALLILPQNITSLRLTTEIKPFWMEPFVKLEFPILHSLDVMAIQHTWIDQILNWSLPSLRIIALPGGNVPMNMQVLQQYACTVSIVRMARTVLTPGWNGISFQLPNLQHLYITPNPETMECLQKVPLFPSLRIISVYWPYSLQIPFYDSEKTWTQNRFLEFIHAVREWTTADVAIRILGEAEFHDWLLTRIEVLETLKTSGRHVERQTAEGELVSIHHL